MNLKKMISGLSVACSALLALDGNSALAYPPAPTMPMPAPAAITISDGPAFDYGIRPIGSMATHTFTVTNTSSSAVELQGARRLPPPFSFLGGTFPGNGGTCSNALNPSDSCTLVVQFLPQVPGKFSALLEVLYTTASVVRTDADADVTAGPPPHGGDKMSSVARRPITGSSVPYGLLAVSDAPAYDFGDVPIGVTVQHTLTLTNTGPAPIFKIQPTLTANNGESIGFVGGSYPGTGGTCGDMLKPKSSCTIVIEITPTAEGPISSTLSFLYKSHGGLYITEQLLIGNGVNVPMALAESIVSPCALFADGRIKCWGFNEWGNLGLGDTVNRGDMPGQMGANLPFIDLGTGRTVKQITGEAGTHQCAILDNNSLKCWGLNIYGQLGLGDTVNRGDFPGQMGDNLPPVNLGTGLYAVKVATGNNSSCAILNNNKVKCWGQNQFGQLGQGDTVDRGDQPGEMGDNLPFVDLGNDVNGSPYEAIDIAATQASYCVVMRSGNVKCWGYNLFGQLGLNDNVTRGNAAGQMGTNLPFLDFGNGLTVKQIVAGDSFVCTILNNDRVRCWGYNLDGQLGIGNAVNQADSPLRPLSAIPDTDLGAGLVPTTIQTASTTNHTCALFSGGRLKCWGFNAYGQLGLGDTANRGDQPGEMGDNLPFINVGTNLTVNQVITTNASTCTLLNTHQVKCWGQNQYGQLGQGNTVNLGDQPGEMGDNLPFVILL